MQFLADVTIPCEACGGKRFKKEVLEVKYRGADISDILDMTVDAAIDFFGAADGTIERRIVRRLQPLHDVGLGYIKLGQWSSTMSGGENQRVKLAAYLADERPRPTVFIFDEPTTGLHFHDIHVLLDSFARLIDKGHTLIIIEHNLDVVKCADHVIDLGPGRRRRRRRHSRHRHTRADRRLPGIRNRQIPQTILEMTALLITVALLAAALALTVIALLRSRRGETDARAALAATQRDMAALQAQSDARAAAADSRLAQEREAHAALLAQVRHDADTRLAQAREDADARLDELRRVHDEQLRHERETLSERFKSLATDVLNLNSEQLDRRSRDSLEALLAPMRTSLDVFTKNFRDAYDIENRERLSVREQLQALAELNRRVSDEAGKLNQALRGNKEFQGKWGEMVLRNILEASGLEQGRCLTLQAASTDDEGAAMRPDAIITCPDDRRIIIDSKAPLNSYLRYIAATDDRERDEHLKAHVRAVERHVAMLRDKDYQTRLGPRGRRLRTPLHPPRRRLHRLHGRQARDVDARLRQPRHHRIAHTPGHRHQARRADVEQLRPQHQRGRHRPRRRPTPRQAQRISQGPRLRAGLPRPRPRQLRRRPLQAQHRPRLSPQPRRPYATPRRQGRSPARPLPRPHRRRHRPPRHRRPREQGISTPSTPHESSLRYPTADSVGRTSIIKCTRGAGNKRRREPL